MPTTAENNKRIAKNTLILYVRMIFMMIVSLYTSRVVLNALGVEDYGVYNVVGGVVTMFSFVSSSLSAAINRFMVFELGTGNMAKLKRVFSTGVTIQLGISVVFILLAETIGLWFLNTQMNIPDGRMQAANWVLHLSVLSFILGLISVPYNSAIIAHERMSAFAYVSILDAVCKLAVAYALTVTPFDRLVSYAVLLVAVSTLIRLVYGIYCKRNFEECTYHFIFDRSLFRAMTAFAGWNFLGTTAYLFNSQGVNMLMNIFFGVTVNAARGVAIQVDSAVRQFITSFTTAVNPQITKYCAARDYGSMQLLLFRAAKFATFLYLLFAIPIGFEAPLLLDLWLKNPPDYGAVFAQLLLLGLLVDTVLANGLYTSTMATGNIKKYEIAVSVCGIADFFLTWVAFLLGCPPQAAYIIWFVVYGFLIYVRLRILRGLIGLSLAAYATHVVFRILPVMALSVIAPVAFHILLPQGLLRLILVCLVCTPITMLLSYSLGMTRSERSFMRAKAMARLHLKFKN